MILNTQDRQLVNYLAGHVARMVEMRNACPGRGAMLMGTVRACLWYKQFPSGHEVTEENYDS
jgi:hypothetical protein